MLSDNESEAEAAALEGEGAVPIVSSISIQQSAISALRSLGVRTVLSFGLRTISSLVLARLLLPKDYGLFYVVVTITGMAAFLRDVGLSSALVHQERAPSDDETTTVFWSQQFITIFISFSLIAAIPWLVVFYHLTGKGNAVGMLIVMSLTMFLSSLRIVPMLVMERNLKFAVIARCEMMENIAQTAATLILAFLRFGAWALVGGTVVGGVVGLCSVWLASPWRPSGKFVLGIASRLARFGIPFQLNAIVPTIGGTVMSGIITRGVSLAAFGLFGWASNIASIPLMLSGILNRVAFPSFSRLQNDREAMGRSSNASVRRITAVFGLLVPLFIIICPIIIPLIFSKRWIPAIPLVQWLSLETVVAIATGILAQSQSASGHPSDRLYITIVTNIFRVLAATLIAHRYGLPTMVGALYCTSAVELLVTSLMLKRRLPGCDSLVMDGFGTIIKFDAMLAIAFASRFILPASVNTWEYTAITLFVFMALAGLSEFLNKTRPLTREFTGIIRMARRTADAPA